MDEGVPRPRYAHQVVYDEKTGRVFLHGGNAGERDEKDGRDRAGDGPQRSGDGNAGDGREMEGTGAGEGAHGFRYHLHWSRYDNGGVLVGDGSRERDMDGQDTNGDEHSRELRLDDFWSMTLVR